MKCFLILLGTLWLGSGCSMGIYGTGKHRGLFKPGTTREQIVQKLGDPIPPTPQTVAFSDHPHDLFLLKGAVYDPLLVSGSSLVFAKSFGLSEIIATPVAIFWRLNFWKKNVTFVTYHGDLTYWGHSVNHYQKPPREKVPAQQK